MKTVAFSSEPKTKGPSNAQQLHQDISSSCRAQEKWSGGESADKVGNSWSSQVYRDELNSSMGTSMSLSGRQKEPTYHHHLSFPKHQTVLAVCYLVASIAFYTIPGTAGIDCFKCVSLNGANPSCEDPFHNNYSVSILESPCMGGRKGRNGLFPATACIKLAGRFYDTGETITVRGCALDSGTLNVDTEIIRMSHCGHFEFEDRYVKGCLQSCEDADGCNGSSRPKHFSTSITALVLITSIGLPVYFLNNLVYRFPSPV